ncbi:hypothetical protein F4804DRAFT_316938, partial [Jackrogersella minutella]
MNCRKRDEFKQEETTNPLLRFMWSDFRPTEDCISAQDEMKEKIVAQFIADVSSRNYGIVDLSFAAFGIPDLSFVGVAENRLMYQTLWKREPFQLYCRYPISRPIGASEEVGWNVADGRTYPVETAEKSLVTWDGRGDLGVYISNFFGVFDYRYTRCIWSFSNPAIVRVSYDAPQDDAPGYQALKSITFDGKRIRRHDDNHIEVTPPEEGRIKLALIVVVRLRSLPWDMDLIRRYGVGGNEIVAPAGFPYSRNDWRLGEPGRCYMLYYARAPKYDMGVDLPEVLPSPAVPESPDDDPKTSIIANKLRRNGRRVAE